MENKKQFFYVLLCKDNSFYGGYTTDLTRRLKEHNQGIGAKYTQPKNRRPLEIIHAEAFETRSQATQAEAFFKNLSRSEKENYLRLHQNENVWHKML